jgi:predicted secreted protein
MHEHVYNTSASDEPIHIEPYLHKNILKLNIRRKSLTLQGFIGDVQQVLA